MLTLLQKQLRFLVCDMPDSMYQKSVIDHYRHPRNKGEMENPTVKTGDKNSTCGDSITLQLRIENNVITESKFLGTGCAICPLASS